MQGWKGTRRKQLKTVGNALAEPGEFSQENREYQVNMDLKRV